MKTVYQFIKKYQKENQTIFARNAASAAANTAGKGINITQMSKFVRGSNFSYMHDEKKREVSNLLNTHPQYSAASINIGQRNVTFYVCGFNLESTKIAIEQMIFVMNLLNFAADDDDDAAAAAFE